jgi:hypothetical protein
MTIREFPVSFREASAKTFREFPMVFATPISNNKATPQSHNLRAQQVL